jgi:hypothetical protein
MSRRVRVGTVTTRKVTTPVKCIKVGINQGTFIVIYFMLEYATIFQDAKSLLSVSTCPLHGPPR